MTHHAIVVSFDRLHLGYLGCYGNDWIETPNFDRLAVESVVFDLHFGEHFDPHAANHAWWTGRYTHALDHDAQRALPSLPDLLRAAGVHTHLLIETAGEPDPSIAPPFDHVESIRGTDGEVSESETPFAQLVSHVAESLSPPLRKGGLGGVAVEKEATSNSGHSTLLWLKSRGVPNPWIPPREFTDLYFDEFNLTEPRDDKDADLQYARAFYAAYVTTLDRWLGKLLATLHQSPSANETLLIVTAAAGERLGEHGLPGDRAPVLHEELIHAPLFVCVPGNDHAGSRRQALVQTVDLVPTLLDWFGAIAVSRTLGASGTLPQFDGRSLLPIVRGERESIRDAARLGIAPRHIAIRTPEFLYVRDHDADAEQGALYEKPHDRWEMADVSRQRLQSVEDLESQLATPALAVSLPSAT